MLYVSLPEIGGYTSPEIFVNKKSNWFSKTIYRPQTSFSTIFPWTSIAYFHYKKDPELKFELKMSINCCGAR